jgi:Cytochrome B6-F complex subunit 5
VSASTNLSFVIFFQRPQMQFNWGFMRDLVESKAENVNYRRLTVVEPLLSGIVIGLIVVTLAGLFYTAYEQLKRDNQLGL